MKSNFLCNIGYGDAHAAGPLGSTLARYAPCTKMQQLKPAVLKPFHNSCPACFQSVRLNDKRELINSLLRVAEPVQIRFLWRPLLSDPRDDMVLETAVNGRADLLVTFNQNDFTVATKAFAQEIVRPSEALNRSRAKRKHGAGL